MALYLADGLEKGRLDYYLIFTNPKLISLKGAVDAMLVADGRQDLIVPIV